MGKKEIYDVKEVAKILTLSNDRVYEYLRRGNIRGTQLKKGSKWLISHAEVERLKGEKIADVGHDVEIEFDHETDLGYYQYEDLPVVRKFACVRVVARRGIAHCCEGTLKVVVPKDALKQFPVEFKLQWFDEPYNEAVKPVDIITSRQLCVVFTEIPAGQIVKRPDTGVVIYPPVAHVIAPDKIRACPSSPQWVKLDILPIQVIGRQESMDWHRVTPREGAWIGTARALCRPDIRQAYLPPGQYDINVRVRCNHGGDAQRLFTVESPREWSDLEMRELAGLPNNK